MLRDISGRRIGADSPLFVIAEIGLNHGGAADVAVALVDAAADAGASAIKLQTLDADKLVSAAAPGPQHLAGAPSIVDLFRSLELDVDGHRRAIARARERGLAVISTPLFLEAVDLLETLGVDACKIASGDLTWTTLIERVAQTGKPLIISTGMSTLDEVDEAVHHARNAGAAGIALLHCVSCYPVPAGSENLRAVRTLAERFGVPVGLSDHGTDPHAAATVVALGGVLYEKHIMLNDGHAIDAAVSATPAQLAETIAGAERVRLSLGSGDKECVPAEQPNRVPSRRSLRAVRPLAAGHTVTPGDVIALRPGDGLEPSAMPRLIGTILRRSVGAHEPFMADDLRATGHHAG